VNLHPEAFEDDRERLVCLELELGDVGERWSAAVRELVPIAERLASLEGQLRAVRNRLGRRHRGPEACELATTILLGRLGALRPALALFETTAAAEAAEQLLAPPMQERLEVPGG
jgi:hypothetical protein